MAEDQGKRREQQDAAEDAPEVVAHEAAEDTPCIGFTECGTFSEE